MLKLAGKTILITGGSSGIGLALATQLLQRGNTVIVTGRDAQALQRTQQALPHCHVVQSDVSDPTAIVELHAVVMAQFPQLDVLINNAGIMRAIELTRDQPNDRHDLQDITREIDINLSGPIRMVQQFLPHLMSRQQAAIINVSSVLAYVPYPLFPVYSATKAALHAYTQALRIQCRHTNVRVIELAPPGVQTPLLQNAFKNVSRRQDGMDVDLLARITITAIERGSLEIRPGISNAVRWLSRIAPQFTLNQIVKLGRLKTRR